jgi:hypothetical protein
MFSDSGKRPSKGSFGEHSLEPRADKEVYCLYCCVMCRSRPNCRHSARTVKRYFGNDRASQRALKLRCLRCEHQLGVGGEACARRWERRRVFDCGLNVWGRATFEPKT